MVALYGAELRFGKRAAGVAAPRGAERMAGVPCPTIDGERREITKREAVVTQLVGKSTGADLRTTKLPIDMLKDVEKKAGMTPLPEPAPFTLADEEVMATFITRLRQSWEQELPAERSGAMLPQIPSPVNAREGGTRVSGRVGAGTARHTVVTLLIDNSASMHGRPPWSLKLDIVSDEIRPWDDTITETASAVVVLVRVPINAAPIVFPAECYKRFN
jgi:hypothetical protein